MALCPPGQRAISGGGTVITAGGGLWVNAWARHSGRLPVSLSSTDLEGDVRDGIERIKASPFVPRTDSVRGFVYEVETGRLREVS